ncbi:MAG: V-type ATP synthase subunit I [Thermoplasmatota archaeon]
MLFPSEMSRVAILTHQEQSHQLVERLHHAGLMEISRTSMEDVEEGSMHPEVDRCASRELRLTRILNILKQYEKKQSGIRAMLQPSVPERRQVQPRTLDEQIAAADELLEDIERFVINAEDDIEGIDKHLDALEEQRARLEKLAVLDIDLAWLGTSRFTVIAAGLTGDVAALCGSLADSPVYVYSEAVDEDEWAVLLVAHRSDAEAMRQAKHFEEIEISASGPPEQMVSSLEREKSDLEAKKKQLTDSLREIYHRRRDVILAIREEISLEKERREIPERFGRTRYTTLIQGWCLAGNAKHLERLVEEATDGDAAFTAEVASRDSDEAPIHLDLPGWAGSFRTFLELFALPKYNEINPSMFLGVSLILFFAIMLGDAGYGICILVPSIWAYLRLGRYSDTIHDWSLLGIWMGIGTIIAGFLFNGFFGDFIPRFIYGNPDRTFYSATLLGVELPIDALHKPLIILSMTLLVGLAHLNLGILLGAYQNFKRGRMKDLALDQAAWVVLQLGGGALIGSMLLDLWTLPSWLYYLSLVFTVVGLVALFVKNGPMGFFELTGYIGDWLSYARLLALGLATAGMAMAFNIVAELLPSLIPYVGVVLAPVVLVLAHLINLLLQALGAGVHALRLQYVEFFGRFYDGGGRKYTPFQIERKYTEEKI